jgi:hypothetical protein
MIVCVRDPYHRVVGDHLFDRASAVELILDPEGCRERRALIGSGFLCFDKAHSADHQARLIHAAPNQLVSDDIEGCSS